MAAAPSRLHLPAQGVPLCIWDHGGAGPPVLFLHGFLDTGRSFDGVVTELDGACRALCLDWRGHGQSERAPAGAAYHQLDHLKDLAAVLDQLAAAGLAPAAVVAHSLGGVVGLMLACAAPELVPAWLFLDACGGFPSSPQQECDALAGLVASVRKAKPDFREFADLDAAAARVQANNPGLSLAGAQAMVRHATETTADGKIRFLLDPRLRGPNPVRYCEETWRAMCHRVEVPVRVLVGASGIIERVPEFLQRVAEIPGAQARVVQGVGHHLHLDAAAEVAAELRLLLAEL